MWLKIRINFRFSVIIVVKVGEGKRRDGDEERIFGKSCFFLSILILGKKF